MGSFYSERRQYENRISRLESEVDQLQKELGSSEHTTKEKETLISDFQMRLAGLARTKESINGCLNQASGAIKAALSLQVSYS